MSRYLAGLMVAVLTVLVTAPAQAQKDTKAKAKMAAAWQKEHLEHDLPGAIKLYKEVADKYGKTDPAVAAQALLSAGDAYRQMGAAQARGMYEQVVKTFPNQKEAVALAHARLGGNEPSMGQVSRTVKKFAESPGGLHWGTLSPDGRFFSHSNSTSGDIYIHDIARDEDRNITNKIKGSKGVAVESAISPDGKRIAYVWSQGRYSLWIANLTGEPNPRVLYDNENVYDLFLHGWSPDGKSLAVVLHHVDKTSVQVALLSASDGSPRVLRTLDWHSGIAGTQLSSVNVMQFSPDGRYLAYDRPQNETDRAADIHVLAVDGSVEIPAVVHPANDRMVGWSPDGKWLLFSSDRAGRTDLLAVAVGNGKPQGQPRLLREDIDPSFRPMGWTSSEGLYYSTRLVTFRSSKLQLASFDVRTDQYSSVRLGTRGYQEDISEYSWSPDGKRLAYISRLPDQAGENPLVVIRDTDTGKTRELRPRELTVDLLHTWAPDARSLFVHGFYPTAGTRGVYRLDVENGDSSLVALNSPQGSFSSKPLLFPSGLSFLARVAYGSSPAGIYQLDTQTGGLSAMVLDEPSFRADAPKLSADGNRLYYARRPTEMAREGVRGPVAFIERNLTTGTERELIGRPALGEIHLSPDGRYVATSGTDPASNSRVVLLIPVAGGQVRELMRVPSEAKAEELDNRNQGQWVGVAERGWTSDGQSFLVRKVASDRTSPDELWLVPLSGGDPRRIGGGIPTRSPIGISPDGRHFVYAMTDPGGDASTVTMVAVLENFLPKPSK